MSPPRGSTPPTRPTRLALPAPVSTAHRQALPALAHRQALAGEAHPGEHRQALAHPGRPWPPTLRTVTIRPVARPCYGPAGLTA